MSYRVYPVSQRELRCDDYKVWIEGEPVALDAARVSAHPINRRWPGTQRPIDQTELNHFLSFAMDGPVTLRIEPREDFEEFIVRPLDAPIKAHAEGKSILLEIEKPGYYSVEPFGRNHALMILADPMVDFGIDPADENVLYYGPGCHEAGVITLTDGQTLFLDEGAVVYGRVEAEGARNICIAGHGILDAGHNKEKIRFEAHDETTRAAVNNAIRWDTIRLKYCDDVRIEGITIRDSLLYNIRPIACRRLEIRGVKLLGNWRYNSDGIDMHNCEDVLIEKCFLRNYDDCICVKGFDPWMNAKDMQGGRESYVNFKNVLVRDCVLWNDWGKCLEIGAETQAEEICDITFRDCHIIHATHAVLDCMNVDYADIHDVTFENICVEYEDVVPQPVMQRQDAQTYEGSERDPDYTPLLFYCHVSHHYEYSVGERRGRNHHFLLKDIYLNARQKPILKFKGFDAEHLVSDMVIDGLYWNGERVRSMEEITLITNEFTANIELK